MAESTEALREVCTVLPLLTSGECSCHKADHPCAASKADKVEGVAAFLMRRWQGAHDSNFMRVSNHGSWGGAGGSQCRGHPSGGARCS